MKLHLPVRLFKSVLACLAAMASFTVGSGVAWADAQDLTFSGATLTWNTAEDNKAFVDAEDAAASFAEGDNVSFTATSKVSLGEHITAGVVAIESGADVTIDLGAYTLEAEKMVLSGTLDMGGSFAVGSGDTLEIAAAGAALDSALVMQEKGWLHLDAAVNLNNNDLTLSGNSGLILTATGDGRVYDLVTGISALKDAAGNAINLDSSNNAIANYFDTTLPGSGFWADGILQLTPDGTLQLVRYTDITLPTGYGTTVTVDDVSDISTYSSSATDVIFRVDSSNLTNHCLTINGRSSALMTESADSWYFTSADVNSLSSLTFSNATKCLFHVATGEKLDFAYLKSVTFSGNSSSYGSGAIYASSGTVTLSGNGEVTFSRNAASGGSNTIAGAIYALYGTVTLSGNGEVTFSRNAASGNATGGAIYAYGGTVTLSGNEVVTFSGNTDSGNAIGGAIYATRGKVTLSGNGAVTFSGNTASCIGSIAAGGAIYASDNTVTLSGNGAVTFSGNTASSNAYSVYGGAIYASRGTVTLSGNEVVTFSNNTASSSSISVHGGAIYAYEGTVTLSGNEVVTFSGNSSSYLGGAIYAYNITLAHNGYIEFVMNQANRSGGAIYAPDSSSIEFLYNRNVNFNENQAWQGGAIYSLSDLSFSNCEKIDFTENGVNPGSTSSGTSTNSIGGAIYSSGKVSFVDNGIILFEKNQALMNKSNYQYKTKGGAICANDILFDNNVAISFERNSAERTNSSYENYSYGGAISSENSVIVRNTSGDVVFLNNTNTGTAYGGSIYAYTMIHFVDNGDMLFERNGVISDKAGGAGGAIYAKNLTLANNEDVTFKSNYEISSSSVYRLRSLYITESACLSSKDSHFILIQDSVYIGGELNINSIYVNELNENVSQLGDIIFNGKHTEQMLYDIKGVEGTATEISNSLTSSVFAQTNLYDGRLRIEDGAIFKGCGITVHESVSGESTPILQLKDAKLSHAGYGIIFHASTSFELHGVNAASASTLTMNTGSAITFHVMQENFDFANLRLTGAFTQEGALTLNISFNDSEAEAGWYKLMTVTSITDDTLWTSENVTVNGLDGYEVSFDDLKWEDNTLYLNYDGTPGTGDGGGVTPTLLIATWTNESGDGLWNGSSLNWSQDEVDYAYKDAVQVVFGDEGAGTVTLVDALAPESVLVNNSTGKDYIWNADATEGGKLTGSMALTKKGEGKLTINTANDYTGGTSILGGTVVAGNATALGSGAVSLNNARLQISAEDFANVLTVAGTSSIEVLDGGSLKLESVITNAVDGTLTLSGKVDVSGLGALTELGATRFDVNGNEGTSGFARAAGYSLQVVNGGKVLGSGAQLEHSGLPDGMSLTLGENGLAIAGAGEDFSTYVITDAHAVSVSEILKDVPADKSLSTIEMDSGTLLADASTDTLNATGGTITLTNAARLGGTISGGLVMAQSGELSATLSGATALVVSGDVTLSGNNSHSGGVVLNGGNLTLNHAAALGNGAFIAGGTSSLTVDPGVELVLNQAVSNSGSLTISGSIDASALTLNNTDATRIDVNGNSGASGFVKDAGAWVQVVSGGTTVNSSATILHDEASDTLVLGEDGRAVYGGAIHHDEYLLTGTGVAGVQDIMDAAGAVLTDITMVGGTLVVDVDTAALLTATDGVIMLETGGTLGADSSISGVDIKAAGGSIAATLTGSNTLEGKDYVLSSTISNNGTLVLSGSIIADYLTLVTESDATFIDVNGQSGSSGFAKTARKSVQLTVGAGSTVDGGVTISHKDASDTLVLGADGKASFGGVMDYTHYLLNGELDEVAVSDIIADAGDALTGITVQKGTLTVDAVSKPVTAEAGAAVVLDGGVLNGTLTGAALTLKKGSLGTVSISGGSVMGVDYLMDSVLHVSGSVSISGSYNASALQLVAEDATRIDVNDAGGASGFLKAAGYSVQLVNGGTLTVDAGTQVSHGSIDLTLGADGYATAGGDITWSEYLLTGSDTVNAAEIYQKALDEGYAGAVAITQTGGVLSVTDDASVTTTAGTIQLTSGTLGGSISGATINASAGTLNAALSGNNALVGSDYALSGVLNISGTLTMSGTFTVNSLTTDEAATYIGADGVSGFAMDAYKVATIASGSTADAGATITYNGEELKLNIDGTASAGGTVHYDTFWLKSDVTIASDTIHTQSANALVDITVGNLTVNDETRVKANGGSIELVAGGVLNGSLSGTELTLKSGALNASISGGSIVGDSYTLNEILQVSGNVAISGSFKADALALTTIDAKRVDVVTGNSGDSGFLQSAGYSVQMINGGMLTVDAGTQVTHSGIDLTLGADGYATAEGSLGHEYLLVGSDTVNIGAILAQDSSATIKMQGGTLTVDASTDALTATGGTINLNSAVELGGSISGATINASAGTLNASLSGHNALVGTNYALSGVLNNSGTLTMSGTFTVNSLDEDVAAGYVGLDGNSATSGFSKEAYKSVTIAQGTTANAGATIKYGDVELTLNTDGTASTGGTIDYTMFHLNGGAVSSTAIHSKSAAADITLNAGTLTVNDAATVTAIGGSLVLDGGELSGSAANTAITLKSGKVNASISGGTITGVDYALSEALQVSGNVAISGSFKADALALTTIDAKRIDVVTGNSGNSGFLQSAGYSVQMINGGMLTVDAGTQVTHSGIDLTLGADGYATAEGSLGHEYLLVGGDTVNVGAILAQDSSAIINMQGGTLTVDAATNALTATGGTINLNSAVELGGSISGATINASAGTLNAALSGNNALVGSDYALGGVLNNSGTLTMSGTFTVNTLDEDTAAGYVGLDGNTAASGFTKEAYKSVTIAGGTTADAGATIKYNGEDLTLNTDGTASKGGAIDYTMFHLNGGVVSSSAIHDKSAAADITLNDGTLTVNDAATVTATGGSLVLDGGELSGSAINTAITLKSGKVHASISGGTITGVDYALSEALQVSGNVAISGSFKADALALTTIDAKRIDVVTGNSGNSGFLQSEGYSVQMINGGTLTVDAGTQVTHSGIDLTLGADGYATAEGSLGHEYLLVGSDTVNVGAILAQDSSATINMQGGTLTVDAATNALTATGGTINLNSAVELGGSISGATINASAGTLNAALSGNNALVGSDYALGGVLNNSGTLTMSGTFTVNSLTTDEAATYIGADGVSGFAKDAYKVATIASGATADAGATITYNGEELKLNTDGTASAGGTVHYDTFWLKSDVTIASDTIHTQSANALVDITAGNLTVNDETSVKANGGSIELVAGGVLNGSLSGTELTLKSGALNASISGGSIVGDSYTLNEILQVSGNVAISGSFKADALALTTIDAKRVDVVTGNSGDSGFLQSAGYSVQMINGGMLTVDAGTQVTHSGINLTLGTDGYATAEGSLGHEYLLVGSDTVSIGAILAQDSSATIKMQGGTLTVDASTDALTSTGGTIILGSDVTLHGSITSAAVQAAAGTLAASVDGISMITVSGNVTLSGANSHTGGTVLAGGELTLAHADALGKASLISTGDSSLLVDNGITLSLQKMIENTGKLTIKGIVDISSLSTTTGEMLVNTQLQQSTSGFLKTAGTSVDIMNGGTLDSSGATITVNGQTITLDEHGYGELGQHIDFSMYTINGTDSASVKEIMKAAKGEAETTDIVMNGGSLSIDADATGSLSLTGTAYASVDKNAKVAGDVVLNGGTLALQADKKLSISGALDIKGATDLLLSGYGAEGLYELLTFGSFAGDIALLNPVERMHASSKKTLLTTDDSLMIVVGDKLDWTGGNIIGGTLEDMEITYKGDSNTFADITGDSSVTVNGGDVCLSGNNSYTGGTEVNGGSLTAGSDTAFGTGDVTLNDGKLDLNDMGITNDIIANGGILDGATNYGGDLTVNGDLVVGDNTTANSITVNKGDITGGSLTNMDITYKGDSNTSADITGDSSVTVEDGDVCLSGNNSYTGGTVVNGGSLTVDSDTAFGTGDVTLNDGVLDLNNKKVTNNLAAHGGTIAGGSHYCGSLTLGGHVTLGGNLSAGSATVLDGTTLTLNDYTLNVNGSLTMKGGMTLDLAGSSFGEGDTLITFGRFDGDVEDITLLSANGDYALRVDGNALILELLGALQEPAVIDREACDMLVQANWGAFSASHAFTEAVHGQRTAAGYVAGGYATVWMSALGGQHTLDSSKGCAGANVELYGGAVGIEGQLDEDNRMGFAFGHVRGEVKPELGNFAKVDQDGTYAALYGAHTLVDEVYSHWVILNWSMAYGDTESKVKTGGSKTSWEQDSIQLNARLDWVQTVTLNTSVSAFAGMEYYANNSDELADGTKSGSVQNLRGEIGVGVRHTMGSTAVYAELSYLNDMLRHNPTATVDGLRGQGANPGRHGIGISAGLQQNLGDGWSVNLNYSMEAMQQADEHRANIGIGKTF